MSKSDPTLGLIAVLAMVGAPLQSRAETRPRSIPNIDERCFGGLQRVVESLPGSPLSGDPLRVRLARSITAPTGRILFPEGRLRLGGRPVHLERINNWGLPPELHNRAFRVVIPIDSTAEGQRLFSTIMRHMSGVTGEAPAPGSDVRVFRVGSLVYGHIAEPEDVGARGLTFRSLVIDLQDSGNRIEDSGRLLDALIAAGLHTMAPTDAVPLSTASLRHDWAYFSYQSWADSLSVDEIRALGRIGTADYREIHSYLRAPSGPNPNLDAVISQIDGAIGRGRVDQAVTVYRADSSPSLRTVWDQLTSAEAPTGIALPTDPAYTFTSLEPSVADMWNRTQLRQSGIILEISVPEGARAAYLDSQGHLRNRGYMELLLPRQSQFRATGAYTRPDGQRVLRVEWVLAPS